MAVIFSAVTISANDQEVEFFVGGIPREYDDLEGWTAFDNFMEDLDKDTEVAVHAEAYRMHDHIWTVLFQSPLTFHDRTHHRARCNH